MPPMIDKAPQPRRRYVEHILFFVGRCHSQPSVVGDDDVAVSVREAQHELKGVVFG